MDLSAVIFVVLALAWAVYLIPKALQHHDEMASDRLVEGHSERVRILRRKSSPTETVEVEVEEVVETSTMADEQPQAPRRRVRGLRRPARRERPQLTPAGQAARRRRRVLGVLVLALVASVILGYLSYVPRWVPAIPVVLARRLPRDRPALGPFGAARFPCAATPGPASGAARGVAAGRR